MNPSTCAAIALSAVAALTAEPAHAAKYQFEILANPDALRTTQDKSLDVLHTITIDADKIASFDTQVLSRTESWLGGGITMDMTHAGKTVRLNDGFDIQSSFPTVPGAFSGGEGFISLSPGSIWFLALEFGPGNPFIDANQLPYDPFVYGFLFAYQDQPSYIDFGALWGAGDTSVLPLYQIAAVPEPSQYAMYLLGLGAISLLAWRRGTGYRSRPGINALAG